MSLRQAKPDDAEAAHAILDAAAADLTVRFGRGHWSMVRTIDTLRRYAGSGSLYVADVGDDSAAVLRLTDRKIGFYRKAWFAQPQDPAGYVMDMAVHPTWQRRGVGRRAMELIEEVAIRAKLRAIRLDAYQGPAGAGEFYRKGGYVLMHGGPFREAMLDYFEKQLLPR